MDSSKSKLEVEEREAWLKEFEEDATDKWNRRLWKDEDILQLIAELKQAWAREKILLNLLRAVYTGKVMFGDIPRELVEDIREALAEVEKIK